MTLEPKQFAERNPGYPEDRWDAHQTQEWDKQWSNSIFFSPDGNNHNVGLLSPAYSLITSSRGAAPAERMNDLPPLQVLPSGIPYTRLTARFPGNIDASHRTGKILEESPIEEPEVAKIRTRPAYVKAEDNNSPIPYYPTISAHWDKKGGKRLVNDCCFTDFLGFFKLGR